MERSVKYFTGGLFTVPNDADQDTQIPGPHERPLTHQKHIHQDTKRRKSKGTDSTVNKTEHRNKRNPTGKLSQ